MPLGDHAFCRPQGGLDAGAVLKGVVGVRTWLLVGYIALLHVVVMLQFHHAADLSRRAHMLP